jgi:dTDP-4-dehydrorhamnose reductase
LFVHYSTDYVFDGTGTRPYREDDPTAPVGVYGASKLAGEEAVRSSGARHLILRTAWVYAAHGSNFLLTMLRLARERDRLKVVADQQGSPTSAGLIADTTARILERGVAQSGIRHLTASGQTSWHGFAEAIFAAAIARGVLERAPVVDPIATSDYPTPARRPAYSVLDNRRLQDEYAIGLPDWRDGLDQVIAQLASSE